MDGFAFGTKTGNVQRYLPKEAWIFNCPLPPGEVNCIRILYRRSPADKENVKDSRKMKISVNQNLFLMLLPVLEKLGILLTPKFLS